LSLAIVKVTSSVPSLNYQWAKELQVSIAKKIMTDDCISKKIEYICGVDVSYRHNIACTAAVILNFKFELIESVSTQSQVRFPYIPGLFMLREAVPILKTIRALKHPFDVLLVDGHGVLHPRRCGLASYVGYVSGIPTIGVAKKLFVGVIVDNGFVEYEGDILGCRVHKESGKDIFVSVGHSISLHSAVRLVTKLTKINQWIPEPLRIADINSKNA
jgi:deoxyribonuclease V